jgi:hypothetical protein
MGARVFRLFARIRRNSVNGPSGLTAITLTIEHGLALGLSWAGVGFVVSHLLALATHEAGDALGGHVVGRPPRFVRIGAITLTLSSGRWPLGWTRRSG